MVAIRRPTSVSGGALEVRYDRGYFRGRRAICSLTSGAPPASFGPGSRGGDFETILWPIEYSLHYMDFTVLPAFVAAGIQGRGFSYRDVAEFQAQLEAYKAEWARRLETLDDTTPRDFPGWADWDEAGRAVEPGEAQPRPRREWADTGRRPTRRLCQT